MPLYGSPLNEPIDLHDLLRCGLDVKPDDLAMVSAETRWAWRELDRRSDTSRSSFAESRPESG